MKRGKEIKSHTTTLGRMARLTHKTICVIVVCKRMKIRSSILLCFFMCVYWCVRVECGMFVPLHCTYSTPAKWEESIVLMPDVCIDVKETSGHYKYPCGKIYRIQCIIEHNRFASAQCQNTCH